MNKEKIFVTGSRGLVGSRLIQKGCSRFNSDVTDKVAIDIEMSSKKPDLIIHLAGKSSPDWCDDKENQKLATKVNFRGSCNIFSIAEKYDIPVVYLSSDYVFSGNWFGNYKENSVDFNPKNFYGTLKLAVESATRSFNNVNIVRTSTLFYADRDIVKVYLDKLRESHEVTPPVFLWRSFMHINDFTSSLLEYCDKFSSMPKILHISGSKVISWCTLISAYAKEMNLIGKINPRWVESSLHGVPRPMRTGLNTTLSKKLGITQHDFLEGIRGGD